MTHTLKIEFPYFEAVQKGWKTFELRQEDDKTFAAGDILRLREWDSMRLPYAAKIWWNLLDADAQGLLEPQGYTGRECRVEVTYVLRGEQWLQPSVVALGIRLVKGARQDKEVQHD